MQQNAAGGLEPASATPWNPSLAKRDSRAARITGKLCFARATHRGVQRGEVPLRSFQSPKIEDPPQEEWGIQGVEHQATPHQLEPEEVNHA